MDGGALVVGLVCVDNIVDVCVDDCVGDCVVSDCVGDCVVSDCVVVGKNGGTVAWSEWTKV